MKYILEIRYDGSNYFGSQRQRTKKTIQGEIERKIDILFKRKVNLVFAGRTDAGVHAYKQICMFELEIILDCSKIRNLLNEKLNSDIYITKAFIGSDDFHPRYSNHTKTYKYSIKSSYDVFDAKYFWCIDKNYSIDKLREASNIFIGNHDFNFFSHQTGDKDTWRVIDNIEIHEKDKLIEIYIFGNGFLRHMIRLIVGTIIMYANDTITTNDIKDMLKNRYNNSIIKAPPGGLYLFDIKYK